MGELAVFSGDSNCQLANDICKSIGVNLKDAKITHFPDGETLVKVDNTVRGQDCFIIQSTSPPVDSNLMELLIFVDCLRRASANSITVVIPYFGYARQDRKDRGRVPITAKLAANLIVSAGANRMLAVDLHAKQIEGFFDIPVDHLSAFPVFARYYRERELLNYVVLSPDVGNMKMAGHYAKALGLDIAVIDKRRIDGEEVETSNIVGDIEGKNVLMFDDMISTAGTICSAVKTAKEKGALNVEIAATHGLFCGGAIDKIASAGIERIVVSDTVPLNKNMKNRIMMANNEAFNKYGEFDGWPEIEVVSIAKFIGESIIRVHDNRSVSILLDNSNENIL